MITVCAITCPKCQATIFSRVQHDFRPCPCGVVYIDGGLDYTRIGYDPDIVSPKSFLLKIEQTRKELYDDWNHRENKYGLIQEEIPEDRIEPPKEILSTEVAGDTLPSKEKDIPRCITDDGNHIMSFDGAERGEKDNARTMISFKCIVGSCTHRVHREATYEEIKALNILCIDRTNE